MTLVPAWAPNLHPLIVHFPIALLVTAIGVDLLGWLLRRHPPLRNVATVLFVVGTLTAGVAYRTGRAAERTVWLPGTAHATVNAHGDWALWTVWFFVAVTAARLVVLRGSSRPPGPVVVGAFLLVGVIGLGLLYATGDLGAQLVFRHGVGTMRP